MAKKHFSRGGSIKYSTYFNRFLEMAPLENQPLKLLKEAVALAGAAQFMDYQRSKVIVLLIFIF